MFGRGYVGLFTKNSQHRSRNHVPQSHRGQLLSIAHLTQADCVDKLVEEHRDVADHKRIPEGPNFCKKPGHVQGFPADFVCARRRSATKPGQGEELEGVAMTALRV